MVSRIQMPGGNRSELRTAETEPLKITLVLSGAVALGSFEAGVIYELLRAVEAGAPLTVDVIAGASAGSLVGAMTAKCLVMGVPYQHVLPRWTEFTLQELTSHYETPEEARLRGKPPDKGILSSQAVRDILDQYLVRDLVDRSFQPSFPAPRLVLVTTLTNLDGIPSPVSDDGEFRFSEAVYFRFAPPDPHRLAQSPYPPALWRRVALVGRASSAFPGAFDPEYVPWVDRLQIPGLLEEFWENDPLLEELHAMDPSLQPHMRYADGGILDEQPVERAIAALPLVTGGRGEAGVETLVYDPRRCILFIEPDPPATALDALRTGTRQTWFHTFTRAIRLWTLSASPHGSERRVLAMNRRQEKLFHFLADLARQMREEGLVSTVQTALWAFRATHPDVGGAQPFRYTAGTVGEAPGLLNPELFRQAIHAFYQWLTDDRRFLRDLQWLERRPAGRVRDVHQPVVAALLDLREAYRALKGVDPTAPERHQEVLEEVHASLAQSLGLSQPWVALHEITPEDPRQMLKGEEIVHFGGFFSKEFLQHDFEVGRYYAHLWLQEAVPDALPTDPPAKPPETEDGLNWRLLWQNRLPLMRMVGRITGALLETAGLKYAGGGQLLVRLLGWSLVLSLVHTILLIISAWFGWLTFPPQYQEFRFWVLLASSLFPLVIGIFIGLTLRSDGVQASRGRRLRRRR